MSETSGVLWTSFERAWRDALMQAMIPEIPGSPRPGLSGLELDAFWAEYRQRAPFLLRAGFRASVWLLTFLPVFCLFSYRPFHRMTPGGRDEFLAKSGNSGSYLIRQLVVTVKLMASLAYFTDTGIRRTFPGVPV
jgi:hypothetical protein